MPYLELMPEASPKPAWADVFRLRRIEKVGSQEELAFRADVSQSLVSQIERGIQSLSGIAPDRLGRLLRALGWTLESFEAATGFRFDLPRSNEPWAQDVLNSEAAARRVNLELVTVYALAAAGTGVYTEEDALGYVYVERHIAQYPNRATFAVDGNSMEPTLSSGDAIHVDPADTDLRNDKIYLVEIEGSGYVVKRAKDYGGGVWFLVSDNPAFPPLPRMDARVIGRVFGVSPQMRRL